jgi:isopenicillin N synthase-like dioxygenase
MSTAALEKVHDFDEIPVIDIGPLFFPKNCGADDEKKRQVQTRLQAVQKQLYSACRTVGFFYVKNHNVSKKLVDTLFSEGVCPQPIPSPALRLTLE